MCAKRALWALKQRWGRHRWLTSAVSFHQSGAEKVSLCYINARRKRRQELSMKAPQFAPRTLHPCVAVAAVNLQIDQTAEAKAPRVLSQSKSSAKLKTRLVVWMMVSSRLSCFYWSLSPNTNTHHVQRKCTNSNMLSFKSFNHRSYFSLGFLYTECLDKKTDTDVRTAPGTSTASFCQGSPSFIQWFTLKIQHLFWTAVQYLMA